MARRRSSAKAPDLNQFVWNTCNTIDDVTSAKVKLNTTFKRWDGVVTTALNMEPRQPQDFAVTPRPQRVFREARSQLGTEEPEPYDPATGWSSLPTGGAT